MKASITSIHLTSIVFFQAVLAALFFFSQLAHGQIIDPIIPRVTIVATVPVAKGPANPGVFTVYRAGLTNSTLNIFYKISGTASNGVDYAHIPGTAVIPAGATYANIDIVPLHAVTSSAVESVNLQLYFPLATGMAQNYIIAYPSNATVVISAAGISNIPPTVKMTSPPDHSVYRAPVNIPLYAYASDPDGTVSNVEFYAGTSDLGSGRRLEVMTPMYVIPGQPIPLPPPADFALTWSNAPIGNFAVTAVATDNLGASTTSAPVNISILPAIPPPTNRPAIVGIWATDPIAVEGTNCWVWPVAASASGLASGAAPGTTITWSNWPPANGTPPIYLTNCGPKNAAFTVRRYGVITNDLTIPYSIGGTASNGVDYVTLPGSITIPTGSSSAVIPIVPIDDGPPDTNKTVILSLIPSTVASPGYVIGPLPVKAAVLILDGPWPRPQPGILPDHSFHLSAAGPDGAWFHVECTTDFIHWTPVCTNQVVQGSIDFIDPDASASQTKFYRAIPEASAPSQ